jgi:hypothetical protein
MKAIKIIERLLTQNAFHEQHVLYKNYPPVKLGNRNFVDDEEEGCRHEEGGEEGGRGEEGRG